MGFLSLLVWALEREDQGTPSTESTPCRTASIDTAAVSQWLVKRITDGKQLAYVGKSIGRP